MRQAGQLQSSRSDQWQLLTDAVEKVRGILLTRNNRIIGVEFLNRTLSWPRRL